VYTSCPARSHICTSIGGAAGEGDATAPKRLAELGVASGAPKPLDDEIKEELDTLAPKGVAGNIAGNIATEAAGPPPHNPGAAAPKPPDDEIKEELDPIAPNGVAGNENPNEKGPLLAAAEFPKPAEAAPKPTLARLGESAGAEALCPP
jgi:hypothetical protein